MAEIEIVYRSRGECIFKMKGYCMQCHTQCAEDLGCPAYIPEGAQPGVIPFGDCDRAKWHYKHKGWVGKRYEIDEVEEDQYNPHLDSVAVTLGNTCYEDCVKVRLNGRLIFNNYDDEEEDVDDES